MIQFTEYVVMPDGVHLATDVYLPGDDQYPVVLAMTPYGRKGMKVFADFVVPHGFALVIQDVRGRYDSEGQFDPIRQEKKDGPQTVVWMRRQTWFDVEQGIGILGISYLGEVGLALAARCPEVRTMINVGGMAHFYDCGHRGGALNLHHMLPWTIITGYSPQPSLKHLDWQQIFATDNLEQAAAKAGYPNDLWSAWVEHPCKDLYWKKFSVEEDLAQINIPMLHFSGWYDVCLSTTLALYDYFSTHATKPQHLIIGPWSHNGVLIGPQALADVDFGEKSSSQAPQRIIAWLNYWLKNDRQADLEKQCVQVFITGRNEWVKSATWPLQHTKKRTYFLQEQALTTTLAGKEGDSSFKVDPNNPVTAWGGSVWEFPIAGLNPGPTDQQPLFEREDICRFETVILEDDLQLNGPLRCVIYGSFDGESGDWVVRVVDIAPNGRRSWVADGILRAPLCSEAGYRAAVIPHTVERYEVDLLAVAHVLKRGHQLGIEISGSSFPKWDVNPHTLNGEKRISCHKVYWGQNFPSTLEVTVME